MTVYDPQILGRAKTYEELLQMLIKRRKQLGLSQMAVDHIGGLQDGYCAKIECQTKRMGVLSLTLMLGALKLDLAGMPASSGHTNTGNDFFAERARKGARALNARLTAKQRRENARKGARVRWKGWRAAKAEKAKRAALFGSQKARDRSSTGPEHRE